MDILNNYLWEAQRDYERWIGVDLDGTLANHTSWKGDKHIGEPVPEMMNRVKQWIKQGKIVKIFTARASTAKAIPYIKAWLEKHGIGQLEITNIKDPGMIQLWDDRAVRVQKNTGKIIK